MPHSSNFESETLERLSAALSAHDFFMVTYDIFEDSVDLLIQNIFRKDDYAVKYAVEPLLHSSGPLGQLTVRLKLLYGLGLLSQESYEDIEVFIKLKSLAAENKNEVEFISPTIINKLNQVKAVTKIMTISFDVSLLDSSSTELFEMQLARSKQQIKSILVLAITAIIKELHRDNPLT